jgi:hypothetical protein
MTLTEAEFKFQSLQQFLSSFGFCSEDTTEIVRKIEYDVSTDSFLGFSTPLNDSIPLPQHFRAEAFNNFKMIYDTKDMARLLNVHVSECIIGR